MLFVRASIHRRLAQPQPHDWSGRRPMRDASRGARSRARPPTHMISGLPVLLAGSLAGSIHVEPEAPDAALLNKPCTRRR